MTVSQVQSGVPHLSCDKEFPDLAIEVVITSGGINKLEVYRRLNVQEVWFWHDRFLDD